MSKLRIGLIGAGARGTVGFGRLLTRDCADRCALVALADSNAERARAAARYLGVEADVYENYLDLLDRTDIEAVVITTPDYLHETHAVAALRAGKSVLMDKPLATTARGALNIVAAARETGRRLYMGFNLRHVIHVRKLRELVESGVLGEVFSVHAVEHYDGGRTYMARWNRLKARSGGLFVHKGCHDFDAINWLMQPARPVRVACFGSVFALNERGIPFPLRDGVRPGPTCSSCAYVDICRDRYFVGDEWVPDLDPQARAAYKAMWDERASRIDGYHKNLCIYLSDKDTHDQGIALVEFDNGGTAEHSEYFVTPLTNRRYLVEGTRGHAEADLHGNFVEFVPRWGGKPTRYQPDLSRGTHLGSDLRMVVEFLDCMQGIRQPTADGIDGVWSVAVGEAAEISRAERRVVEISEVLDVRSELLKRPESGSERRTAS
jgi:predicted dehydrogenase